MSVCEQIDPNHPYLNGHNEYPKNQHFARLLPVKPPFKISHSRRQLFVLFSAIFMLNFHFTWFDHPTSPLISDLRRAILGFEILLVYFGTLVLPEPSKNRGSVFWRVVQAIAFTYALNIFVLLFLSKENLQIVLRDIFDSRLGVPLEEVDYAGDCKLYTPDNPKGAFYNFTSKLDMFVIAHFMGWAFKAWIFRNHAVCWLMSVGFELMEYSFEVWLPNFSECWWDHFLLDMFGCNLIGMIIGLSTIKFFKMRQLHWFYEPTEETQKLSLLEKIKFSFSCSAREKHLKADRWHWLSEGWTFNGVIFFFCTNLALDLSYFFMKSQIHLPSDHWLLGFRIWTLGFFSIIAGNDYYDYVVTRRCNSMSLSLYLLYFILTVEWMIFFKNVKRNLGLT